MNSNDKTQFNIQNPGENTRIGSEVLRISDRSMAMASTDSPEQFVTLFKKSSLLGIPLTMDDNLNHVATCYATESEILAWMNCSTSEPTRESEPFARLSFSMHPRMERVKAMSGRRMAPADCISTLKSLRDNLDENGLKILMKAYNFKVSRKVTVEEERQPSGEHAFTSKVEGKMEDSWVPPEFVTFSVPVYKFIPLRVNITLGFEVVIVQPEDSKKPTEVYFKFESLNLDEDLMMARRAVLTSWMTQKRESGENLPEVIPAENFIWGTNKVIQKDDAWTFVQNRFDSIVRLEK